MGSEKKCRYPTIIPCNRIRRSVGLSSFDKPISILSSLATWFGSDAATIFDDKAGFQLALWGPPVIATSFAASMAVNALVTGLIVYKILRVFLEVRAVSGELTLGSLNSNTSGGNKLRNVLFIIIESGMTLFIIQLVRVVTININFPHQQVAVNIVAAIQQQLNVSIRDLFIFTSFVLLTTFYLARASHQP